MIADMRISAEGKFSILLAAVLGIGTGAAVMYPDHREIGLMIVAASSVAIILVWINHLREKYGRYRMFPLAGMAICAIGFVACFSWYFWPSEKITDAEATETGTFSWTWERISEDQRKAIQSALRNSPNSKVIIACGNRICSDFAESLTEVVSSTGWTVVHNDGVSRLYTAGASGLSVNKLNNVSASLINALESALGINVSIRQLRHGATPEDIVILTIGGKVPTSPLPQDIASYISKIATNLQQLSYDIGSFAVDRQRESNRLPPIQADIGDMLHKEWERNRDFHNETSALFQNKFGVRLATVLSDLDILSIKVPFLLATNTYYPQSWAKWVGTVGNLLAAGKIVEARENAADEDFWFSQLNP